MIFCDIHYISLVYYLLVIWISHIDILHILQIFFNHISFLDQISTKCSEILAITSKLQSLIINLRKQQQIRQTPFYVPKVFSKPSNRVFDLLTCTTSINPISVYTLCLSSNKWALVILCWRLCTEESCYPVN